MFLRLRCDTQDRVLDLALFTLFLERVLDRTVDHTYLGEAAEFRVQYLKFFMNQKTYRIHGSSVAGTLSSERVAKSFDTTGLLN